MSGQQSVTALSPSGRHVKITWSGEAEVVGISASVRYMINRMPVGYQIGGPGYHDTASTVVAPSSLRRRALSRGREVLVSSSDDGDVTMVTRRGPHHEVMRVYLGPAPSLSQTLREFELFSIHDRPEGCWLAPRPGTLSELVWEDVTVVVRDRGVVFVPDPASAVAMVPKGAGTRTRRGEIWREQLTEHPSDGSSSLRDFSYVVGSRAGAASVSIPDSVRAPDAAVLDWLDSLDVSWH